MDLTYLEVTNLIVHALPTAAEPNGVLSDAESPLPAPIALFFGDRIRAALHDEGIAIRPMPASASPTPALVREWLKQPTTLVAPSQVMARHLFSLHNDVHSEGLLCVLGCSVQTKMALAIIKLEKEEGVRAELRGSSGAQHFEIIVVPDLMLTKKTRVFKVAMFHQKGPDFVGQACDNQRARNQLLAQYFLDGFLGCALEQKPDVATKLFFEAAQGVIESLDADPVSRTRYHTALLAEMNSNSSRCDPRSFANVHLKVKHRERFLRGVVAADAIAAFKKDTSLIDRSLTRIRLDFQEGMSVLATQEAIESGENVRVENGPDGLAKVQIQGHLGGVRGSR